MRIYYYGKSLAKSRTTGVERVALELLRALSQQKGVEIVVVGSRFVHRVYAPTITYRKVRWLNDLTYSLFFGLLARRARADVILSTLSLPCVLPLGIKQAVCVHDLAWKIYPARFTRLQLAYFETIHRLSARLATFIYCPSRATANDMKRFYAAANDIKVFPWGADHFQSVDSAAAVDYFKESFGVDLQRSRVLVSLGTLQPRKGYEFTLDALRRFPKTVVYIVFGSAGWMSKAIAASIDAFNVDRPNGSRVLWIRSASDELVASTFACAELFLLASEHEGFGLPVVEAMRSGCPVAVAANSSLSELIGPDQPSFQYGDTAALVDVLQTAFSDPSFYARQRELSMRRAVNFEWRRTGQLLLDALRQCEHK